MEPRNNQYRVMAIICAILALAISMLFFVSWQFGFTEILRLPPSKDIYPYSASVCLFVLTLGSISIHIFPKYPVANFFGFIVTFLSLISLLEFATGIPIQSFIYTDQPHLRMSDVSAWGYIMAAIPLMYWKPYNRGNYKDQLPLLFAITQFFATIFIMGSYYAKQGVLYESMDSGSFNFYGALSIMFVNLTIICSVYYFRTTAMLSSVMKLPVLVSFLFVVVTVVVSLIWTVEGTESVKGLLQEKQDDLIELSNNTDFPEFQKISSYMMGDEYGLQVYEDLQLLYTVNERDAAQSVELENTALVYIDDKKYRLVVFPTNKLSRVFINRTATHLFGLGGLMFSAVIGALFRLWQVTKEQLASNKKLQDDLKSAISLKDNILQAAEIGTWRLDLGSQDVRGDPFFGQLLGLEFEEYNGKFQDILDMLSPQDRESIEYTKNISIRNKTPFEAVLPIRWRDGNYHYILFKGKIFFTRTGQPNSIEGIAWDISEIKRTQQYLQVSEAIAKLFAERKDIPETCQKFIEILHEFFGWEVMVLRFLDVEEARLRCESVTAIPGMDINDFKAASENTLIAKGIPVAGLAWSSRRICTIKDIEKQAKNPLYADTLFKGALGIPIVDNTTLLGVSELYKRTEFTDELADNLRELMLTMGSGFGQYLQKMESEKTQAELAAIVTNSHEGMYSLTKDGIVKSWNKGAETIFGWSANEVIGKPIKRLYTTEAKQHLEVFFRKASQGKDVEQIELEAVRKDGGKVWVNKVMSAIRDNNNNVVGCCALVADVSEQKELERAKHEFVSMISHELRTPLTSIHGALGLLRSDESQPLKVRELMDVAFRNSERLTYLVNDILTIEKFELGRLQFNYEIVNIEDIVNEAIQSTEPLAKKRSITFRREGYESKDISVKVERARLVQVLLNYLSNAIKFSHEGGVVYISIDKRGDEVRVSVRDNGVGISQEMQGKIFGKFYQGASHGSKAQGTGLGLFISKTIIEGMGGRVGFTSIHHQGSTFYFELPIVKRMVV